MVECIFYFFVIITYLDSLESMLKHIEDIRNAGIAHFNNGTKATASAIRAFIAELMSSHQSATPTTVGVETSKVIAPTGASLKPGNSRKASAPVLAKSASVTGVCWELLPGVLAMVSTLIQNIEEGLATLWAIQPKASSVAQGDGVEVRVGGVGTAGCSDGTGVGGPEAEGEMVAKRPRLEM